jgi:hypothetical protein
LCGLPEIDIEDWKRNTEYTGDYERKGASHKVVKWFWEVVVDDFDEEHKARLLQFVTGTSGVTTQRRKFQFAYHPLLHRYQRRDFAPCKATIIIFASSLSIRSLRPSRFSQRLILASTE